LLSRSLEVLEYIVTVCPQPSLEQERPAKLGASSDHHRHVCFFEENDNINSNPICFICCGFVVYNKRMLTRPEVHEAEAKIALIFFSQISCWLHFQKKIEIFGRFSTGLRKFRFKTGSNVWIWSVNTHKTTSYAFGRWLLLSVPHLKC